MRIICFTNIVEVRDIFRIWRENSERKSKDVVDLWESTLKSKINNLGNESKCIFVNIIKHWIIFY